MISTINEISFAMKDISKMNNSVDDDITSYEKFSILLSENQQKQIRESGMVYSNQIGLYPNIFSDDKNNKYYVGLMILENNDPESFCKRAMPKIYSQTNSYGVIIGLDFYEKGKYNTTQIINACDNVGTAMKVAFFKYSVD